MKTINISVRDKLPIVTSREGSAVEDNKYRLKFEFDDEWVEGLKTIVVATAQKQYTLYPTVKDYVDIELGKARTINVGVLQDTVATSRPCQIIINESIRRHMGEDIAPPDPDIWTYITEQIRALNAMRLYPVDKTEAMTQQVGRDTDGKLWTYPGGEGGAGGIDHIFITGTESSSGRPSYTLNVQLTNGKVVTCPLPNMGLELSNVITVSPSSPLTSLAVGNVGELWFDTTDRILYVCISSTNTVGAPNWVAVGGSGSSSGENSGRGVLDVVFEAKETEANGAATYNMIISLNDGTSIARELPGFRNEDVVMFQNDKPGEDLFAPRGKLLLDTRESKMYVCAGTAGTGDDAKSVWVPISGSGGIFVGEEADMPAGTVARFNPKGKATKILQIDETLSKTGYAADAAAVGTKLGSRAHRLKILYSAPTETTEGYTGQIAFDDSGRKLYVCTDGINETKFGDLYPNFFEWKQLSEYKFVNSAPTRDTYGTYGEIWVNFSEPAIYICEGPNWMEGGVPSPDYDTYIVWRRIAGLPEFTPDDEGKTLQIKNGAMVWKAGSGGGVQVDDTLSKTGYAADAAAVGEALKKQSKAIDDKLDANKLPEAINTALAQAKASGEFNGEPGAPGDDYVLTDADKREIAELVDVPEGGEYRLLKTITVTEATQRISESWGEQGDGKGYDGVVVTFDNISGIENTNGLNVYASIGSPQTVVGVGAALKNNQVMRLVARKLNGLWDIFGSYGEKEGASTMLGQTGCAHLYSTAPHNATPDGYRFSWNKISRALFYTFAESLPVGMTIKIFVLGGEENA